MDSQTFFNSQSLLIISLFSRFCLSSFLSLFSSLLSCLSALSSLLFHLLFSSLSSSFSSLLFHSLSLSFSASLSPALFGHGVVSVLVLCPWCGVRGGGRGVVSVVVCGMCSVA